MFFEFVVNSLLIKDLKVIHIFLQGPPASFTVHFEFRSPFEHSCHPTVDPQLLSWKQRERGASIPANKTSVSVKKVYNINISEHEYHMSITIKKIVLKPARCKYYCRYVWQETQYHKMEVNRDPIFLLD